MLDYSGIGNPVLVTLKCPFSLNKAQFKTLVTCQSSCRSGGRGLAPATSVCGPPCAFVTVRPWSPGPRTGHLVQGCTERINNFVLFISWNWMIFFIIIFRKWHSFHGGQYHVLFVVFILHLNGRSLKLTSDFKPVRGPKKVGNRCWSPKITVQINQ